MAVELVPDPSIETRLVSAAFVEGIFAAVIAAAGGASLDAVARDAEDALQAKATQLGQASTSTDADFSAVATGTTGTEEMIINPDGIHARPAALIVGAVASLDAQVRIATETSRQVSARSPTALMSLGARMGDTIRIQADGPDRAVAFDRIVALVRNGFGEMRADPLDQMRAELVEAPFDKVRAERGAATPHPMGVSPGRVVGPIMRRIDQLAEPDLSIRLPEADRSAAVERLADAAAQVAVELRDRSTVAGTVGELMEATALIATDPDLIADASARVREQGLTPERAVWETIEVAADSIRTAGARQALRVPDLYDGTQPHRVIADRAGGAGRSGSWPSVRAARG
jgi:multiphosphoryl transfer protein